MEEETYRYFEKIETLGGVIPAIEKGFFQKEIAKSAYRYQKEIDEKQRIVVGVNEHALDEPPAVPLLKMDAEGEKRHLARLTKLRSTRNNDKTDKTLLSLQRAAKGNENLMPYILASVHAYATLGEICDVLRNVFGAVSYTHLRAHET